MQDPFSFVFYNTENFYDTIDDPATLDDDFTPEGRYRWTEKRFRKKIRNISLVLKDVVKPRLPDVVALAEIENLFVLQQLRCHDNLSDVNYRIIHYDSPDERGSDVGLLYNPETFFPEYSEPILVRMAGLEDHTRDILYVCGKLVNGEKVHIFITHFPSRREGTEESEARRLFVAGVLRKNVDKVLKENPKSNIIIMGDFNDEPYDRSVRSVLKARNPHPPFLEHELYNLMYPRKQKGIGTTFHKGWLLFDQIIVSGSMLSSESGMLCRPEDADVFNPRYLLHLDPNIGFSPHRTYGYKYYGGYSDHLPVYLNIRLLEKKK
ncbi:MAG: hypothetical protein LUG18_00780 [Candidatus Azobacteroides sp.]|nr:hypothetical protein [Candidatus Azobacteroides sp.]